MDYNAALEHLISEALREDVGPGDYSTLSTIDATAQGRAVLKIKQDGILAGMQVAERIFQQLDPNAAFVPFKKDGDRMAFGEKAFEVSASIHTILKAERLVLNSMQRMSGIATLTRKYVDRLEGFRTKLLDTRKTTPNFRLLEKEAVRIGGAVNHRFGLYDMIMLKDNHIDYCGGIRKAIELADAYVKTHQLGIQIEVETRSLEDVKEVLAVGKVHRIMLDNFKPSDIDAALVLINGAYETEASGGINYDNIIDYAETGVDYISSGSIIHQAVSLDLSLKAILTN